MLPREFLWCILYLGCKVGCPRIVWWLSGISAPPGSQAILEGKARAAFDIEERISVPASIYQWKASESDRERALTVQLENRRKFQDAFRRGLAILGFSRDAQSNGVFELGSPTQAELD